MVDGIVFNIQKFCTNDGPGIRTVVFLKGCPLNCIWCHNPESKQLLPELLYSSYKCVCCGKCVQICPNHVHDFVGDVHIINREKCSGCGKCVQICRVNALDIAGVRKSVDDILKEVREDKLFYTKSGGGMTLSGGEPMFQHEFAEALLKAAKKEDIHTCIETCGYADAEVYKRIIPYVDIFLFDYKETNIELHKKYTGVSNERIISNLKMIDSLGGKIILRCPIIPTLNDTDVHLSAIADVANSLDNIVEINIAPYHNLGKTKSERQGKKYVLEELTVPSDELISSWIEAISHKTNVMVKKF